MNFCESLFGKLLNACVIATACLPLALPAQEKPTSPATFSYEVVSIKPINFDRSMSLGIMTTDDGLNAPATNFMSMVFQAFPIITSDQLAGLPQSAMFDYYNLQAKMSEQTAAALKKLPEKQQADIRRAMLLQVLVERCKLKYHKETREMPIYNLVVAKSGPKFKETPPGITGEWHGGWAEISGDNIEMGSLLGMLTGEAQRYIVDKTGLTGKYSLTLKWNPNADQDLPASVTDQNPEFKGRPGFVNALEQQLGLKLEPAKGPVDVYVIDHIEKPSEN